MGFKMYMLANHCLIQQVPLQSTDRKTNPKAHDFLINDDSIQAPF